MSLSPFASKAHNRRSSQRLREPGGTARCSTAHGIHSYFIRDASDRGVALQSGPGLDIGTPVHLELVWPRIGHVRAEGVVCRTFCDGQTSRLGVHIAKSPGLGALFGTLVELHEIRQSEAVPLFCGDSPLIRSVMHTLDSAGYRYVQVQTPLEAILELQDPWQPISSVVFVPTLHWLDFAQFLSADSPEVRRVLLSSEESRVNDTLALERGLITNTLRGAWDLDALHAALGLKLSSHTCPSCHARLSSLTRPFCDICLDRSTDLTEFDDLGGLS